MTTLTFNSNKNLKSLARETLGSKVFHQPYTKETTEQRGFFLVKDEGIYIMDAYADKHPDSYNRRVIYASGYNPKHDKHGNLWDRTYAVSRDDFGEFIPMDEDALIRIMRGGKITIKLTPTMLEVRA
tara:strand:+ start:229 stop:609 length:381 start_codon:yes stop_codon:yes gene_type:complete